MPNGMEIMDQVDLHGGDISARHQLARKRQNPPYALNIRPCLHAHCGAQGGPGCFWGRQSLDTICIEQFRWVKGQVDYNKCLPVEFWTADYDLIFFGGGFLCYYNSYE